jgi:hypothetical protein
MEELVLKKNEINDAELMDSCGGYDYPCFYYTVQYGDTLSGIAYRFHTDMWLLVQINGIANPDRISVGQVLVIPYYYY